MDEMHGKAHDLKNYIASLGSLAVAFSAGVDSTYLLKTASDVLGDKAVAITVDTPFFQRSELQAAYAFTKERRITHYILQIDEGKIPGIGMNPVNRCYLCKSHSFSVMKEYAASLGFPCLAEGTNADDVGDYRPGMKAVEELGILSPLKTAGLAKAEIRALSKEAGLATYNKPSCACLASRIPYGQTITEEKLRLIESAEEYLKSLGFPQVRVRLHENLGRIEVPEEDIGKLLKPDVRKKIYNECKKIGFAYVSLDLDGYQTGKMNEEILKNDRREAL